MISEICWIISLCLLLGGCLVALVLTKIPYRRGRILSPVNTLLATVFLSTLALFYPIYHLDFGTHHRMCPVVLPYGGTSFPAGCGF